MTARASSHDDEARDRNASDAEAIDAALGVVNDDQTLGRYELLTPIGRGGMAMVWAARLRGTRDFSTIVAVKTMLPALSSDPRFETMFLAEAEIASRIKHPNVGAVLDLGEDRNILYLVMEWIDGEPLSTVLDVVRSRGMTIPYPVAASIAAAAARGLHSAHEPLGVVHRDVSPQNILVHHDGHVKIVDFGVAKAAQRTDHVTQSGYIKGKVAYLAPEQVRSPTIDRRADIFALGTVLYEITTGAHPFRGATELDTLLRIASSDPVPPIVEPGYPEALRTIVERALAKEPADRYATMDALASDLEACGASMAEVAAFVASVIGHRRGERALVLREAMRAADERADRRRRREELDAARVEESRAIQRSSRRAPAVSRRTAGVVVAVGLAGTALGGAAVWASLTNARSDAATAPSASAPPAAVSSGASVLAAAAPEPAPTSSATPVASAAAPIASALPRARASAPVPKAEGTSSPALNAQPSSAPKARFCQPDF